jgi:hypothetical protein
MFPLLCVSDKLHTALTNKPYASSPLSGTGPKSGTRVKAVAGTSQRQRCNLGPEDPPTAAPSSGKEAYEIFPSLQHRAAAAMQQRVESVCLLLN